MKAKRTENIKYKNAGRQLGTGFNAAARPYGYGQSAFGTMVMISMIQSYSLDVLVHWIGNSVVPSPPAPLPLNAGEGRTGFEVLPRLAGNRSQ